MNDLILQHRRAMCECLYCWFQVMVHQQAAPLDQFRAMLAWEWACTALENETRHEHSTVEMS